MSTIISTVTSGITITAAGSYTSPLTITSTGAVLAPSNITDAVYSAVTDPSIYNQGTLNDAGYYGNGVRLINGGSIGNTGLIRGGSTGIQISGARGTITNTGTIASTSTAGNAYAIDLLFGGTVTDSGTISAAGGTAVSFGGNGANLLILDPGYHITGKVVGSTTAGATNTLELAVGSGLVGALSGIGTEFVNFGTVTVDANTTWILSGDNTITNGSKLAIGGVLFDEGDIQVAATASVTGARRWRGRHDRVSGGCRPPRADSVRSRRHRTNRRPGDRRRADAAVQCLDRGPYRR